jgi:hypothetical protein
VSAQAPKLLDYAPVSVGVRPPRINIAAALSLAFGVAGVTFIISLCSGMWSFLAPSVGRNAGWCSLTLSLLAMITGAVGAFRAPLGSWWYPLAWIGYSAGILGAVLTPLLFL